MPDAKERFAKYGKNVSQFIQQWNADPNNRDKMYVIFQELMKGKEEMLQNLNLLNDRDQLLEEGLVKAEGLNNKAKLYKENTKKVVKHFDRRKCCCWSLSITGVIVVLVGVFLILWLWLHVINF
jgi:hypothetical protein